MNKRNLIANHTLRDRVILLLFCTLYFLSIPVIAETAKTVIAKENQQLANPIQATPKDLIIDKDKLNIPTKTLSNPQLYELEKVPDPELVINPDIVPIYPLGGHFTPLPDLAVTAGLDIHNRLIVRVRNDGRAVVPSGVGDLLVYIDGTAVGNYDLGRLANQSFRTPGNYTDISSNFRLAGALRRVLIRVDTANQIAESNEHQNDYSVSLNPPRLSGPDYIIESINSIRSNLVIQIANQGDVTAPADATANLRIIINEVVERDLVQNIGGLSPGSSVSVSLTPAINIYRNDRVRVMLNMPDLLAEVDTTNNTLEEILPNKTILPYAFLLRHPVIGAAISWNGRSYADWSDSQKIALSDILRKIENNKSFGLSAPPELISGRRISQADAFTIYLTYIAQSLWLELRGVTSWRLTTMSAENLAYLLDSRYLIGPVSGPGGGYAYSPFRHGTATVWAPHIAYQFMQNMGLLKDTQAATIVAVGKWMRAHLFHTYVGLDENAAYQYNGYPPVDRIMYPMEGSYHLTIGCWGTTPLFVAILRAVNIPAQTADVYFDAGLYHRRPIFPTLGLTMSHVDNAHTRTLNPGGNLPRFEDIFIPISSFNSNYVSPTPDCLGGRCNTVYQQARYNNSKSVLQLAVDAVSDSLLFSYAYSGETALRNFLTGVDSSGSQLYVRPFFTAAERDVIVTQVVNQLRLLGSGDIAIGERIVEERNFVWSNNIQHRPIE